MCPNCILNQAGLDSGLYVAFGVCLVFFVVAIAAVWWAFRNGEFEDLEEVKFDMMDDDDQGLAGAQARAAVEKSRLARSSQ
ncbi:MAG: cbb3-type cytochrome oxidase assembly protein [Terriglobales bacterium]